MKKILILSSFITLLFSCNNRPKNVDRVLSNQEISSLKDIKILTKSEGDLIFANTCYACHNPKSNSHDNMLAPPLAGIKNKYLSTYPTKELFVTQMADYIFNPTEENALMKGPIKRFGIMPKTNLSKSEAREMALFIFNNKLEVPSWFPEHFEEMHNEKWEENSSK